MDQPPDKTDFVVRPLQYRDREAVGTLLSHTCGDRAERLWLLEPLQRRFQPWLADPVLKLLGAVSGQWHTPVRTFVLEQRDELLGFIQVAPFNQSRSTWRVEQICLSPGVSVYGLGSQLLRFCLESIWEARTWLVEVEVNHIDALGLYRQNGFQPLVQMTRWQLAPEVLAQLATRSPSLPNLLPVNNADAALLYQLDTAAMPPFVRQVFDRHVQDFQRGLLGSFMCAVQSQLQGDWLNGYVFEPQRKAAIGYFAMGLDRTGTDPHTAQMTVHPAYTWLYPELLAHMAQLAQQHSATSPLAIISADYQPEREDYLQQIGSERVEHTLMLSRSVWHKVRESKTLSLETLQLTEMLQGLQPNQTPMPGRMTFWSLRPPTRPYRWSNGTPSESRPNLSPVKPKTEGRSTPSSDMPDPHGSCG